MKIKKYFFGIIALVILTLLTSLAAAENVIDTLDEGVTQTYNLDGIDHDVTVTDIGASKVNFTVDTVMSDPLEEGNSFKFPSHVKIEVIAINDATLPYNATFNLETLDYDFSVDSVSIADPVVVGEIANLQITLSNSGDEDATDVNLTIDKGDGSANISILIPMNATTTFTYDVFGPIVYSGPADIYDLTVFIDYDLAVPETDETNNNKTIEVDVKDPLYNMTVEDATITVIAGKINTGTFTIDNTGNMNLEGISIDLATDLVYTEDISITIPKTAINFVPNPANTSVGRSRTITVTADIPKTATPVTYTADITADHIDVPTTKTSTLTVVVQPREEVVELTEMPSYVFVEGLTAIKTEDFKIENDGNVDLTDLSYEITDLVGPSASITEVDITNADSASSIPEDCYNYATLSVKVTGQPEGDYTGTITVKEAGVEIHQEVVIVEIEPKSEVLSASIGTIELVKISGYSDEVNLTITNDGNTLLRNIEVKIEDLIKDSSNIITTSHITNDDYTISTLEPGKSYTKIIKVTLPSTDLAIGTYISDINISYATDKTEIVIFQASLSDVKNELTPNKDIIVSGERKETVSTTFTLENTGDETLTIMGITALNVASEYNVSITLPSDKILSVGEVSGDITIELYIPESADSGDVTIGSIFIETDKINKTLPIIVSTESKLSFKDVEIEVDGDSEDVDDGETIDDVKPGSTVKVIVKVENEYTDSEDIEIEDIEIEAVIKDIDDGDDLEETSDEFDLDADDYSDEYELEFEIPLDVDEDTYDLEIEAEGEDENGIKHSVKWVIKLKVEKEKDDVIISRADIFPDVLKCNKRGSIEIKVINMGSNDMDDVYIEATSSSLGLSKKTPEFNIDEGDSKTKTIEFDVGDKPAGTYTINVELYDDDDDSLDGKTVEVIVQDCEDEDLITVDDTIDTTTTAEDITSGINVIEASEVGEEETEVTESKFTESGSYVALLVLMNIIVIGIVVYLFVVQLTKPKI